MFTVGDHVRYYGVDHSPSYLWDSATWEISEALLPYLADRARRADGVGRRPRPSAGPSRSEDGVIRNPSILAFQSRSAEFPHPRTT